MPFIAYISSPYLYEFMVVRRLLSPCCVAIFTLIGDLVEINGNFGIYYIYNFEIWIFFIN